MRYATTDQLRGGYIPALSENDATTLDEMLERASRAIDSKTRRHKDAFAPSPEEPSDQLVYGAGQAVLLLPDFIAGSVASVTPGVEGTMPPKWVEFRRRDAADGVLRVGLHTAAASGILTPRVVWMNGAPFTVRARFGFAETPAEVVEATLKLVRAWWRAGTGEISGTTNELQAARAPERGFPREVLDLIEHLILADVLAEADEGLIEVGDLHDTDTIPWIDPKNLPFRGIE